MNRIKRCSLGLKIISRWVKINKNHGLTIQFRQRYILTMQMTEDEKIDHLNLSSLLEI